jgi:hypothetical protein
MDSAINLKTIVGTQRKEATGFNSREATHSVVLLLLAEVKTRPPNRV